MAWQDLRDPYGGLLDSLYAEPDLGPEINPWAYGFGAAAPAVMQPGDSPITALAKGLSAFGRGQTQGRAARRDQKRLELADRLTRAGMITDAETLRLKREEALRETAEAAAATARRGEGFEALPLSDEERQVLGALEEVNPDLADKWLQDRYAKTKPTPTAQLLEELRGYEPGSLEYNMTLGALKSRAAKEGFAVDIDPETGAFSFRQGAGVGETPLATMTDSQRGKQVEAVASTAQMIERGWQAYDAINDDFMTYGGHLEAAAIEKKEKAGLSVSPEERAYLSQYTTFHADSARNFNQNLRAFGGANMTEQEIERATVSEADSKNDSPTEYRAKLHGGLKDMSLANVRRIRLLEEGLSVEDNKSKYSLAETEKWIRDKASAAYKQALDAGADEAAAWAEATRTLSRYQVDPRIFDE